jgi:hypothetical protein
MMNGVAPAGWYQDPTGQGDGRYWNGASWTESVDRGGVTVNVAIDPSQAQVPPVAGTEVMIPAAAAPTTQTVAPRRSPVGAILGGVLLIIAIVVIVVLVNNNNNDSSDDSPPATGVPAVTEAPAPPASDGG